MQGRVSTAGGEHAAIPPKPVIWRPDHERVGTAESISDFKGPIGSQSAVIETL